MFTPPQPQTVRRDNAFSVAKDPGEIFNCIVTRVTDDGRVHVHVPELGSDLGPILPLDTDLTNKCKVEDTVVGAFLTSAMSSFVIFGLSKSSNRSSILIFATEAERNASLGTSPSTGVFTYLTDTSTFVYWDGTAWQPVAGGSVFTPTITAPTLGDYLRYDGTNWVNANFAYKVGDTGPGGGIIFFVDRHNEYADFDMLEVAPAITEVQRSWATNVSSNQTTAVSGADSRGLGAGYQNTLDIVAQTGNVAGTCAARYCADLVSGGQSDWYLPSISEVQLVRHVVHNELGVGGFVNQGYWSSTENSTSTAWYHTFNSGDFITQAKSQNLYVRPVRRF